MNSRLRFILIAVLVCAGAAAFVALPGREDFDISLATTEPGPPPAEASGSLRAAVEQTARPEAKKTKETTIRNVTDKTIVYKIYPARRPQDLKTHEIVPNAIDRYPTEEALVIEFVTGEREVVYSLDPGAPYSFRYDKGDQIELFLGSHGRADAIDLAPWVPSPDAVVDEMLRLGNVGRSDVLYDIGCGDGRIVITAARKFGARGVGIDIDPKMVAESEANAKAARVTGLVKFIAMDATKADVSEATVVTMYLLPESNALMRPILEKQLKPGARVVTHNYAIPGWEAKEVQSVSLKDETGVDHTVYLYIR